MREARFPQALQNKKNPGTLVGKQTNKIDVNKGWAMLFSRQRNHYFSE
jgi:hypothetical protein